MKELRLDDYLDSVRADGVTDSEGSFTISHAQAMKKMARYSLPYPEAWVLKIVQAAVIWKASKIEIKQTQLYTTIGFCPQEKKNIPTENEVVATLIGDTGASAVPVANLCLGLRTLVRIEDYSFILTLNTGRTEVRPLYAGRDAQSLTQVHRLKLANRKAAGIQIVIIHLREGESLLGRVLYRFNPWLGRRRQIANELARCAGVCSIPIHLNGRHLTNILESVNYGLNSETRPLLLSGVESEGHPTLELAVNSREALIPYFSSSQDGEDLRDGTASFSAWYLCQAHRKAVLPDSDPGLEDTKHEIKWISNGVVVQCDTFVLPTYFLKLVLFLNANDLKTDITGFLLQDSSEKVDLWEQHFALVKKELKRWSLDTERFFPKTKAKKNPIETENVQYHLKRDLARISELENPEIQRLSRPETRRAFRRRFDYGLIRTESGKYISEVVNSDDGSSHVVIRVNSKPTSSS